MLTGIVPTMRPEYPGAPTEAKMTENQTTPRYDVLLLSEKPGFQLTDGAARALLRYMMGKRWVGGIEEAVAQEWAELYLAPGPSSHEMFMSGPADTDEPVFEEMAIRFGKRTVEQPYGGTGPLAFYMELRGCRFKEPRGIFRKAMLDVLNLRVRAVVRDHEAAPPHAVVPEDELPEEVVKTDRRSGGAVGTRVEEF